ncbi:hypothetical protein BKA63DRAFT_393360, partial [Paraphoma chrysanthemicola]
ARKKEEERKNQKEKAKEGGKDDVAKENSATQPTDESGTSGGKKKPKQQMEATGGHWGMLIVDKTQHLAYWVDSALGLETEGKKLKIASMFHAGRCAGKILCGIDAILSTRDGFEKGTFDARTLKYVPHQRQHNTTQNDVGACGPFAFSFLEHLYTNKAKMNNLKTSFPRSRRDQLRFNSLNSRREIRRLIHQEDDSQNSSKMPFGLTPAAVRALGLLDVDTLLQRLRPFRCKPMIDTYESVQPGPDQDSESDDDDEDNEDAGGDDENNDEGDPDNVGGDSNNSSDDDDDAPWKSIQGMKEILKGEIDQKPGLYSACTSKRQRYQLAWNLHVEHKTLKDTKYPPPEGTRVPKILAPDNIEILPKDFADERAVPTESLPDWAHANANLLKRLFINEKSEEVCIRAALQVLSGISFDNETDNRLKAIWIKEPGLFGDK